MAATLRHHSPQNLSPPPMDDLRRRKIPSSDRFLGIVSPSFPSPSPSPYSAGGELDEGDLFSTGYTSPPSPAAAAPSPRRFPITPSGILAALPEDDHDAGAPRRLALRNPSLAPPTSPSPSGPRAIPAIPRPRVERHALSMPSGGLHHQSAPVNVPVAPLGPRGRGRSGEEEDCGGGDGEEMLPPHEIVARASSPLTTFSVLEGAGRTLKGRDLRRVRNAVWRQTGFLD